MKLVDLIGKRFGRLTVIKREPSESRVAQWLCRCDCGKTTVVSGSNLRQGHAQSCGCMRGTGIVGRRFGWLVVTGHISDNFYHVRCDCGREEERSYASLMAGVANTQKCRQCGIEQRREAVSASFDNGTQPAKIRLDKEPTKANRSGVVGVNWDQSRGLWQASIRFRGHKYNLGRFARFEDAVEARKKAEVEIFRPYLDERKDKD